MKKRIVSLLLIVVLLLTACAKAPTWQEQYDLGMRYLSESNYQEAVIAFAAAIAIDEKRPEAFIGRGDAYMGLAATADDPTDDLDLAAADYQAALALDATDPDVYERLADVYLQQGEGEKALDILQQGLDKTGDGNIADFLGQLNGDSPVSAPGGEMGSEMGDSFFWDNYMPFEDLTAEQQQELEAIVTAAVAGDTEALRAMVAVSLDDASSREDYTGWSCYTMWGEYKIYLSVSGATGFGPGGTDEEGNPARDISKGIIAEIRPENGQGYFYNVHDARSTGESAQYTSLTTYTCPCVGWQWNGELTGTDYYYSVMTGMYATTYQATLTGSMKDNLREGLFVSEATQVHESLDEFYNVPDRAYRVETTYQDGVLIDQILYEDGEEYPMSEEEKQSYAGLVHDLQDGYSEAEYAESVYW